MNTGMILVPLTSTVQTQVRDAWPGTEGLNCRASGSKAVQSTGRPLQSRTNVNFVQQ